MSAYMQAPRGKKYDKGHSTSKKDLTGPLPMVLPKEISPPKPKDELPRRVIITPTKVVSAQDYHRMTNVLKQKAKKKR